MKKELNSIEFLIEQVVMGTYKNGEDKILYKTLPNAMVEAARRMHRTESIALHNEYERYVMLNQGGTMTFGQFYDEFYK